MPIEQYAPGLERIVDLHQEIEELARGFGGESGPAEGPVWWQEGGYLVFSDIGNNRRMQWSPGAGVTLVQEPTNEANGLTRDRQGRLVACEHLARRVTRQDPDGSITVVANNDIPAVQWTEYFCALLAATVQTCRIATSQLYLRHLDNESIL